MPESGMRGDVRIDWCPLSKVSELQTFIDTYWTSGHILSRNSALLKWQYRHLEDLELLSVLLAHDDSGILGFLGLIQVNFDCYGESVPAIWPAMWCTAPHVRSKRVGLALLREALRLPYNFIGSLGLNSSVERLFGGLRFDIRESILRWVRVVSPTALDSLLAGHEESFSPEDRLAWQAPAQSVRHGNTVSSIKLLDWSEETAVRWDRSWRERFSPLLLGTWRDSEYLRWRYVNHPVFRYVLRFAEDSSSHKLVGLLVYRIETVLARQEKVLRVVEFLSDDTAGDALAQAIIDAGEEGVAFADFYCTSAAFAGPLEAAGFEREDGMSSTLPSRFQPLDFASASLNGAFLVKEAIAGDSHVFFDTPALYITRSDGDQDRPN